MSKIIVISGPTASGKSQLAYDFAMMKKAAIINADSLQIYEGLPILSSQPSLEDQKKIPHFLYSILKPQESSSVAMWLELVEKSVKECLGAGKIPVIVGGSGMYISKLIEGISVIPKIDESIRIEALELFESLEKRDFIEELIRIGEEKERILNLDKHRLIRAYEVLRQSGKSISYWQSQPITTIFKKEDFLHINLNPPREKLYQNCNLRFEKMFENGAVDEVRNLIDQGIDDDKQITKTLGFYEISDFLHNRITKEEAIIIACQKTRNYAKRQLTWFRNQLLDKSVFEDQKIALEFLKNYEI